MPLLLEQPTDHNGVLGVWWIKEDEAYYRKRLNLTRDEKNFLQKIKGEGRRIQWLAARYLLHHLLGEEERHSLLKDDCGKPYFKDRQLEVSISHSHAMAAAMISDVACGIDIQYPVEKISRLAPKFCTKREFNKIPNRNALDVMHVIWGAKESMYKAYGRKKISFRDHLRIKKPQSLLKSPCKGKLKTGKNARPPGLNIGYQLYADKVLDYVMTWCFELEQITKS